VLDLVPTRPGEPAGRAIARSVELARHVEQLGYKRYWVAEHHAIQRLQVDGSHRARRQPKLPRHSSHRGALTGVSHRFLKALAEGRLARQQRYFLSLDAALRTPQSIQLDHYSGAVIEARQIPYLPLVDLGNFLAPSTTAGTLEFAVPALAPHPQTQSLSFFVDLAAIDPVPRPSQNLVRSLSLILLSVLKNPFLENPVNRRVLQIPAPSRIY